MLAVRAGFLALQHAAVYDTRECLSHEAMNHTALLQLEGSLSLWPAQAWRAEVAGLEFHTLLLLPCISFLGTLPRLSQPEAGC